MKNYKFTINGNKYAVEINDTDNNIVKVDVNGTPYQVELDTEMNRPVKIKAPVVKLTANTNKPATPAGTQTKVSDAPRAATAAGATLKSPLPGTILDVFVKEGDAVKTGQRVVLLEAMKMENNIDAEKDGIVKQVLVHRSDSVMEGDVLIVFE